MAVLFACAATFSYAQTRSALVHLKSGKVVEYDVDDIDSINFTDPVTYDKVIEGTDPGLGNYYGNGEYLAHISDAPMDADGLPTQVGQYVVRFYAFADKSVNSANAILPSGRYVSSQSFEKGTIFDDKGYLFVWICTAIENGEPQVKSVYFDKGATVNVVYNSDGNYDIDFKGSVSADSAASAGFQNFRMKFHGPISFYNQDPSYYEKLTEDVVMVPEQLSAGYSNAEGLYGDYSCTFLNCPLDTSGFVIGAGELLNLELLTEESATMDLTKLPGEYTIASIDAATVGNFVEGVLYSYYGMYFPLGSYYETFDENGAETKLKGFVKGGSVKVTQVDEGYNFDVDLIVEGDHHVTMNYTAPESSFAMRNQVAPKPSTSLKSVSGLSKGKVNINNKRYTITMIKK